MADIRCPNCGKLNPDVLDVCQFCQTPLKSQSTLHLGDKPTKKNTGELEPVLPDWLRDIRQQARNSAEEDAAQTVLKPKKEEPPDLLAGLVSQSQSANDEEIPDWLASLNSTTKKEKSVPPPPTASETDFFAQFNKTEPPTKHEPQRETEPSSMSGRPQRSAERDELSDWFAKASDEPVESLPTESDLSRLDAGWGIQSEELQIPEQPQSSPQEDLSWLHNLEAESKKTGELSSRKEEPDWFADFSTPAASASSPDDLSWLNDLGSLPAAEEPVPSSPESEADLSWLNNLGAPHATNEPAPKPAEQKEDLSWLNNLGEFPPSEQRVEKPPERTEDSSWLNSLGGTQVPEPSSPNASQPQEDLSWLNAFSENQQPAQPATPATPAAEDLSWLNNLGAPQPQPTQPAATDDLSWLNSLQGSDETLSAASSAEGDREQPLETTPGAPHVSPFMPRQTGPLFPEEEETSIPDWLKSATETPSMPLGADALDQFREDYKIPTGPEEPFSWKSFVPEAKQDDELLPPTTPEPAFPDTDLFAPAQETPALSNQEVDSLFSANMPDWLSQAAAEPVEKPAEEIGIHTEGGEALAPVDLPSWVQAMRPVEAVIPGAPVVEDQPIEHEGPLAGLKGVIPVVPIGSSRRPQPIPLKLQVTAQQQASAAIMEQILASETSPSTIPAASTFASQRLLRLIIAGLLLVALSAVIFMRTQILPVSAILPLDVDGAVKAVELIPDNSSVLVVLDYEPSLAGEMEAASGPLLNQLATLRHPNLSFISTSTNGPGLVNRLLRDVGANNTDGLVYQEGVNYFNLGYLPGGESGILSFVQSPQTAMPTLRDNIPSAFSGYSAVVLLTDHADSARSWIEQLQTVKQADPSITNQPLLVVASAQAGPMLQPYASSRQISGLINGLSDAARLEASNNRPGTARSYWDAFGVGVILAIALIVLGSLWSLVTNFRSGRVEAGEA